jgi:hypothetical protein
MSILKRSIRSPRQIMLPERLAKLGVDIAAEYVVDQDVQAAVVIGDPLNQLTDLVTLQVIDTQRYPITASSGDQGTSFFDGLWLVHL